MAKHQRHWRSNVQLCRIFQPITLQHHIIMRLLLMRIPLAISALCLLGATTGCRTPIDITTATQYQKAAAQAELAGNFLQAKDQYYRAYWCAQAGELGPAFEAKSLFDWARVTGYLGNYEEAEVGFTNVLGIIPRAHGEAAMLTAPTLAELALLLHDTQQHTKAVSTFQEAVKEMELGKMPNSDPIAFANFLDLYVESLNSTGFRDHAVALKKQAADIRSAHPGEAAKWKPRPYYSYTPQNRSRISPE
jgi:tetratricopeptide (TPR) repeat protein